MKMAAARLHAGGSEHAHSTAFFFGFFIPIAQVRRVC
jgi:hypothetical protein